MTDMGGRERPDRATHPNQVSGRHTLVLIIHRPGCPPGQRWGEGVSPPANVSGRADDNRHFVPGRVMSTSSAAPRRQPRTSPTPCVPALSACPTPSPSGPRSRHEALAIGGERHAQDVAGLLQRFSETSPPPCCVGDRATTKPRARLVREVDLDRMPFAPQVQVPQAASHVQVTPVLEENRESTSLRNFPSHARLSRIVDFD
jgi:hypothetical protein